MLLTLPMTSALDSSNDGTATGALATTVDLAAATGAATGATGTGALTGATGTGALTAATGTGTETLGMGIYLQYTRL